MPTAFGNQVVRAEYLDDQVMLSFVHPDNELLDCRVTTVRGCDTTNSPFYKITCTSTSVQIERREGGKGRYL